MVDSGYSLPMTFFQSLEVETAEGGRYRITRGYPTAALRTGDLLLPAPTETWSDHEFWEADHSEWSHIAIFDKKCCWCEATGCWTMVYLGENRWADVACPGHMREYGRNYDAVRVYQRGD